MGRAVNAGNLKFISDSSKVMKKAGEKRRARPPKGGPGPASLHYFARG